MYDTDGNERKAGAWLRPPYLFIILLLLVLLGGAAFLFHFFLSGDAVATVNGKKITRDELYETMYSYMGKQVLEEMINNTLLTQEADRLGIIVTNEEIDEEINKDIEEYFDGNRDNYLQYLEYQGIDEEYFRTFIRLDLLGYKIILAKKDFTEEELKTYFEEHRDRFDVLDEAHARHILVKTREEAEEVIRQLEEGRDFAELAAEYSQDNATKDKGGDLGYFSRGAMVQAFDEAVFAMQAGERSGPVESGYGFHVIEVLDRREGREVSFEEVKDTIKETIVKNEQAAFINELLFELREQADIKYH